MASKSKGGRPKAADPRKPRFNISLTSAENERVDASGISHPGVFFRDAGLAILDGNEEKIEELKQLIR